MREFKFRAWDKFAKKMWAWEDHRAFTTENGSIKQWFDDSDLIQMQWTGLKDKTGKDIYEGDVILGEYFDEGTVVCEVIYSPCEFMLSSRESAKAAEQKMVWALSDDFNDTNGHYKTGLMGFLKIIGNIYENPELLK